MCWWDVKPYSIIQLVNDNNNNSDDDDDDIAMTVLHILCLQSRLKDSPYPPPGRGGGVSRMLRGLMLRIVKIFRARRADVVL